MTKRFTAERALSPTDGSSSFVVDEYTLQPQTCEYLASLRFRERSINTERVYAGRLAAFLTYCAEARQDWCCVTIDDLARFQRWLINEPIHRRRPASAPPFRSNKTANAILTSVCEFLRFASTRGWHPHELVQQLSEPKYLRRGPTGYDFGEDNQFRIVRARALHLTEAAAGAAVAMAADAFAAGAGAAVQMGTKLANRAIGFAGQAAAIGIQGLAETFLPSGSDFADPSKSWPGKILGGFAGARPASENPAGQVTQVMPKDVDPNTKEHGTGHGQPPGPVIGTMNYTGPQADGQAVARDINRQTNAYGAG